MLFNEPKLLKCGSIRAAVLPRPCFSALQRAEIAEIGLAPRPIGGITSFSALQRAEIAEMMDRAAHRFGMAACFSALQRAEIAEIKPRTLSVPARCAVSVLFNEPKLLKY